jgi:leucyl aminopeptidase (aminopeptidase T)
MAGRKIELSDLERLTRSYARLSYDVGGRINFACDIDNEEALKVAEREKAHLDQAFFVLSFAALENQINKLACARELDAKRQMAMRESDFEKRSEAAVKVARETSEASDVSWSTTKQEVLSWYKIRSDIAHGRSPSQLADVPTVLYRADRVAATLAGVVRALNAL